MTMTGRTRPPLWFWIVAVLLLLWGLSGTFACIQQWRLGAEAMGPATNYDRILYARLPGWYNPVYTVATVGGLLGAVALLARSRWAEALFAVSLAAVVIMFGWLFVATDIIAWKGAGTVLPFPILIAAVAAFGIWFSRIAHNRGWIG
jgi:hypothetical protein